MSTTVAAPTTVQSGSNKFSDVLSSVLCSGDWHGEGTVQYDTETFGRDRVVPYEEQLRFQSLNPMVMSYEQVKTVHKVNRNPMHREYGYIRIVNGESGDLEYNLSQITGVNEVGNGKLTVTDESEGSVLMTLELNSAQIQRVNSSAKKAKIDPVTQKSNCVTRVKRVYRVKRNEQQQLELEYVISMATEANEQVMDHLKAKLIKQ